MLARRKVFSMITPQGHVPPQEIPLVLVGAAGRLQHNEHRMIVAMSSSSLRDIKMSYLP